METFVGGFSEPAMPLHANHITPTPVRTAEGATSTLLEPVSDALYWKHAHQSSCRHQSWRV